MNSRLRVLMLCGLAVPGLLLSAPVPGAAVRGQFIRVESGDRHEYLHFAEVEVYVGGRNIAVGRPVKASSTMQPFTPDKAVDGRIEYTWGVDPSFWSSAGNRGGEWWEVDLGAEVSSERVLLYNRSDCCQERLQGAVLTVLAGDRSVASRTTMEAKANPNDPLYHLGAGQGVLSSAERLVALPTQAGGTYDVSAE